MQGKSAAAEAHRLLQQPEATVCSPGEVVPESQDPDSGGLHKLPVWGGEHVDSDLCLHTGFLVAAAAPFHACLWGLS